ncbi:cell wall biogenesis glycosyltransferase-like protein [Flammeovirgaceae bacterium 311]|nr:cell wall biogenesis glycosyltransferase-like protein [Flammeovirgaceae bacterium 311]
MISLVKGYTRKLIDNFLGKYEYRLLNNKHLAYYEDFAINILKEVERTMDNKEIESIVFSKDRAMQLHAFLASYIERVSNRGRMYILYKCTNQRHQKSYDQLKEGFAGEDFVFIEEKEFRKQLIDICEQSGAGKIMFYVDDMIFTHKIDYAVLGGINTAESILSLSRGKDMDFSIVLQKPLVLPPFTSEENNLERFSWNYLKEFSEWTYPLGVSGYMYGRIEVLAMLKSISFKAPNSLEISMQIYLPYYIRRSGLCTKFAACVCVHANLVQSEIENPTLGTYSIEELLILWEKGKRINIHEFYDTPISETQIKAYTFV